MKFLTTILLVFTINTLAAQTIPSLNQGAIIDDSYFEKIPYRNINGKLFVDVYIEGEKYNFLFDTGASLVLSEELFNKLEPTVLGKVDVGSESSNVDTLKIISLKTLRLGNLTFKDTPGLLMKHSKLLNECLKIDGFIGSNMLRNSVIQFDSPNNIIIITDNPKKLNIPKRLGVKLIKDNNQSNPVIEVIMQNGKSRAKDLVLFDSGSSEFFEIAYSSYQLFKEKTTVLNKRAKTLGTISFGLHGAAAKDTIAAVLITQMNLSSASFSNVGSMSTKGRRSRFGTELLKHGTITIDYKNEKFYFDPYLENVYMTEKLQGLDLTSDGENFFVGVVWNPALKEKVNIGDQILKVDNWDFQNMNFCDVINLDRSSRPEKTIYELKDVKTAEVKKVEVSLF